MSGFYLLKGKIKIFWTDTEENEEDIKDKLASGNTSMLQEVELLPGEGFPVPRGRIHQFLALEDSDLLEVSTTDYTSDSYRLLKRKLKWQNLIGQEQKE